MDSWHATFLGLRHLPREVTALRVHERMGDFPDDLLRRHARRLAGRPPSAGALIQEPARSVETACFLRYCLLLATDRLLMMAVVAALAHAEQTCHVEG